LVVLAAGDQEDRGRRLLPGGALIAGNACAAALRHPEVEMLQCCCKKHGEVKAVVEIAPRVVLDQNVRFGRAVIKGTRVPVDLVLGKLAGGMSYEEIMAEYDLVREDIFAALDYAAKHLASEEIRAVV